MTVPLLFAGRIAQFPSRICCSCPPFSGTEIRWSCREGKSCNVGRQCLTYKYTGNVVSIAALCCHITHCADFVVDLAAIAFSRAVVVRERGKWKMKTRSLIHLGCGTGYIVYNAVTYIMCTMIRSSELPDVRLHPLQCAATGR
jgi:hypothetical protein